MHNLISPSWWVKTLVQTFFIMCIIYLIKMITGKVRVPVVSEIAQAV